MKQTLQETAPIDVSLLEYHLRMTPEERIDAHEAALQLVLDLQSAGKAYYEEQSEALNPKNKISV